MKKLKAEVLHIDRAGVETRFTEEVDPSEPTKRELQDELVLERLRSPNGDSYRAEHLLDLDEDGLRRLCQRGKIKRGELEALLSELLAVKPNPLDDWLRSIGPGKHG